MTRKTTTVLLHYGGAAVFTALAVLLRWLLDPWAGDHLPLVTLYGAIAAAVWYGGYRPALIAVVLGYLACNYLFMEPRGSIALLHAHHYVGLALYLFTCSLIIGFGEALHAARRRADQQRESLRVTLTSMGDAVITTDAAGRVTSLNPVAVALTGWTQDEAAGRPLEGVFRILNEQSGQPVENPVKKVLAEGRVIGLANHTTLIARDGTERPIDDSAAPIKDARGLVLGVVLIFRDVTERRRAEKSARLLASIVESSDDAIIGKDVNGIITSWNQGAERIFGYTAAEAVGRPIAMLAPPDRADEMPRILQRIRRGERVDHFDTVRRAKDGRLVPISLTVSPIKDNAGRIVGASKIARDVCERKRAEETLREEKARLHATLTGIGDGVIVTDAKGLVTLMNPVAQQLTGWGEEAAGRPLEEVFRIANEHTRQPVEPPVGRVVREGTVVGLANHTLLIARDGTERPIEDSAAPIKDEQGRVVGVVLVFRDNTERRRVEEALREADRRKDKFLATLAHELRNPLAPLRTALQILRLSTDPQELDQARSMMERQLGQMVRLVDDLLDVSRITRGKVELRKERVELADVVRGAEEACRPLIESCGQKLRVTLPPEPVSLDADPTRLTQVFSNLLNNAAKYSDRGAHIDVAAELQGSEVVVRVKDTGIGIPAEMLARVFELFTQAHRGAERSQGGLGIGLTLVKRLVEMHGGRVEAFSDGPGKGSEFVVRLPAAAGAPGPGATGEKEEEAAPRSSLRILVVDDNRDGADTLGVMLRLLGNDTRTAYDGEEAVAAAEAFRPDVVLLDIGLPELNGYDVCRRIRGQPWGEGVVVIAVTGWGQEEDRRRSKEAGFDHHLVKPVDTPSLLKLLAGLPAVPR